MVELSQVLQLILVASFMLIKLTVYTFYHQCVMIVQTYMLFDNSHACILSNLYPNIAVYYTFSATVLLPLMLSDVFTVMEFCIVLHYVEYAPNVPLGSFWFALSLYYTSALVSVWLSHTAVVVDTFMPIHF